MAPAGKKTCTVLLVDVSAPSMTPHLGWIGDALSRVVQNRMMHAKADEFALVTCGARETKNDVHTEGLENAAMANEHDYEEEYLNISVDVPMACASSETASAAARLEDLAGEDAPADYLDALTVASDVLVRHERGGGFHRRVVFVTDLKTPCAIDDAFMEGIAAGMRGAGVQLVVAVVGTDAGADADAADVVAANEKTLRDLCAALNVGADGETPVPESARSRVDDARAVLTESQIKRVKPTTTFRGELRVTPWMSLRVWGYKKVSEAKPPAMRLFDGSAGAAADGDGDAPMVTRERTFTSYADPDNPKDVPPEMMLSAYPYGPTNIPIQDDVAELVRSKNDKGMDVFGFTPLATVPPWYGMEESRVLVPWPSRAGSAAAGMAASAGISDREAGKAAAAMSALARAMRSKGVAALTRAVWMQNSDRVSFGALTPHCTSEGDFLLFTPLPYAEDAYASTFRPLAERRDKRPLARREARHEARAEENAAGDELALAAAADALVDALDGNGIDPWRALNPSLARTNALLHARAADAFAAPLAEPRKGGPDAAAALDAPPLADAKPPPPTGPDRTARAAAAAAAFAAASGFAAGDSTEPLPRLAGTRRARSLTGGDGPERGEPGPGATEGPSGPDGKKKERDPSDAEDARLARRRRTEPERPDAHTAVPEPTRVATDVDGWVPVTAAVKEEPPDTMQMDTVRMDTLPVDDEDAGGAARAAAPAPAVATAEEDGFFDDME